MLRLRIRSKSFALASTSVVSPPKEWQGIGTSFESCWFDRFDPCIRAVRICVTSTVKWAGMGCIREVLVTQPRSISLTRRRPIGSPLVAAGTSMARDHLLALADRMKSQIDFVEIDEHGAVLPEYAGKAPEAEMLWCHGRFAGSWVMSAIDALPGLDWVHSDFVGVDALTLGTFVQRSIVITNGGNNFSRPMAEYIVLGMLASAKQFPFFVRNSDAGKWDTSRELSELEGAKLLLLGLGSVNSLVAKMCKGFGMDVVAWTRTEHSSLAEGVSRHVFGNEWLKEITDADYVVVGVPLTAHTRGLIDKAVLLEVAKPDLTLINLARGAIIDQVGLLEALDSGRLRYVLLDAYLSEPLPPESPLWKRPNVTVLPHHSWSSPRVMARSVELMGSQLHRWLSDLPLLDPVDLSAGY